MEGIAWEGWEGGDTAGRASRPMSGSSVPLPLSPLSPTCTGGGIRGSPPLSRCKRGKGGGDTTY